MKQLLVMSMAVAVLASCSKDQDPIIVVPPSNGSSITLNGLIGSEAGASAGNSVFVDFSTDKQSAILRDSWDLAFTSSSTYKVAINLTNGVSAVQVNKTDLNTVTEADVNLDTLKLGQGLGSFAVIDDIREANILNKTVIAEISATDNNNKVYVVNRKGGTNGTILGVADLFKIRVLRKGNGYTLQYAKLNETSFKSLDISKNTDFNFQFVSLVTGTPVNVEPEKSSWDIMWSWNISSTSFGTGLIPYGFSDIVLTNNIAGVTSFERVYSSVEVATDAYSKFNKDSAAKYAYSDNRMNIGSNWRLTVASGGEAAGIRKNRFYIIKDQAGNVYKLKFISAGIANDGGTRGKPQIAYELIR